MSKGMFGCVCRMRCSAIRGFPLRTEGPQFFRKLPTWISYKKLVLSLGATNPLIEGSQAIPPPYLQRLRRNFRRFMMKKAEITIGKTYSNGKGRLRKFVDIGPQYKLYDGQECEENMRYKIIADGSKTNRTAGQQANMTLASFASWAKQVVDE